LHLSTILLRAKTAVLITLSRNDRLLCYNKNMKEKKETRTLNKKMLERLIIIHNAIKSGMYPNNKQLQRLYCEQTGYSKVGEATINRDIDVLRTYFQAPLEYDRKRNGYYYFEEWDFALNNISAQDVFYLSAAKTLLSSFQGSPLYDEIAGVIDFVTDTQTSGKSALLKRIAIPPAPQIMVDKEVWADVLRALQGNCVLEFDYIGRWRTKKTHRRVRPYQILLDDGVCYLYGFAEERKAERLFALNRMKKLKVTADHFELPAGYEFSTRCGGGYFGSFASDDKDEYIIDFYGDARQYVKDRVWADDQKITDFDNEDRTRIVFTSTQFLSIQEWVLAKGGNAIPRAPLWLVEEWQDQICQMVKNTKK